MRPSRRWVPPWRPDAVFALFLSCRLGGSLCPWLHPCAQSSDGERVTQAEFSAFVNRFMNILKDQGKRHLEDPDSMSTKEKEEYTNAATLIQAVARGRNDRRRVQQRSVAIERIQAHARGHLVRGKERRRRSILLNEASHAVDISPTEASRCGDDALATLTTLTVFRSSCCASDYKVQGVAELVQVSAQKVGPDAILEAQSLERTEEDAKVHAKRLGLVRHALRNLRDDELAGITAPKEPDMPTLVLAGAVRGLLVAACVPFSCRWLPPFLTCSCVPQLCLALNKEANWASAGAILRDPEFRNKAAMLQSSQLSVRAFTRGAVFALRCVTLTVLALSRSGPSQLSTSSSRTTKCWSASTASTVASPKFC